MKSSPLFYIAVLFFMMLWNGCAMTSDHDDAARQFYSDGDYAQAVAEWQRMCDGGIQDPDVFYNMGIAAAGERNIPLAILQIEKALRFRPGNQQYQNTVEEIRGLIDHSVIPVETFFLLDWWKRGVSLLRPGWWALLAMIVLLLGVLKFLQSKKMIRLPLMQMPGQLFGYIVSGIILLLIAFFSYRQIYRLNEGIVFTNCEMKDGPSEHSPIQREVAAGEMVKFIDSIPGWTKVYLLNLDEGWIKNECYQVIDPTKCQ